LSRSFARSSCAAWRRERDVMCTSNSSSTSVMPIRPSATIATVSASQPCDSSTPPIQIEPGAKIVADMPM
jgi:hypothetical protein